ncbi:RNA ligase [Methanopyrus kandleri]|uniref:ATP-dependent DNA ligase, homolog of eukaryotic ligase III n=2 Tax=Methanopyrus kandleri TaxID=2320 RepID=Q8TXY1_METKA|nr:RNA ligase [Methanopyrus kandleri]AAM01743.1 ATP-dependent DNA ligase, homolog of eukaryotic ligase III [Methanopyrus kandleri AV19]HII70312.1 RNA ligase [Methanopyrus kandleri]
MADPSKDVKKLSMILESEEWRVEKAIERGTIRRVRTSFPGFVYYRTVREFAGFERGTLIVPSHGLLLRGFPKIERALLLEPALRSRFGEVGKVIVEEKMNGHNVRVFELDGEVYAATRGGLICPYTTHKLRNMFEDELKQFFEDYPGTVVCGEFVGKENPYVSREYPEARDVGFFVFDVRDPSGRFWSYEEKLKVDEYGLERVRCFGEFEVSEVEEIHRIVRELDREGREGIVIKDPDRKLPPLKYTTHSAHVEEIEWAFRFAFDLGRDFVLTRTIREGFQSFEWCEKDRELKRRGAEIGRAIVEGLRRAVEQVVEEGEAYEEIPLTFESREWFERYEDFVKRVTGGTHSLKIIEEKEDGTVRAVLRKRYFGTGDKVSRILEEGVL